MGPIRSSPRYFHSLDYWMIIGYDFGKILKKVQILQILWIRIVSKCQYITVSNWRRILTPSRGYVRYLKAQTVEPLTTFMDFIAREKMIDNVCMIIQGRLPMKPLYIRRDIRQCVSAMQCTYVCLGLDAFFSVCMHECVCCELARNVNVKLVWQQQNQSSQRLSNKGGDIYRPLESIPLKGCQLSRGTFVGTEIIVKKSFLWNQQGTSCRCCFLLMCFFSFEEKLSRSPQAL